MRDLFGLTVMAFLFLGLFALFSIFSAVPVYFLWNWLMPMIFGLKIITFWQAWGLSYLAAVLFKSSSSSTSSK